MTNIGISLTGGGARGSYQAGVLKALGEILNEKKILGKQNPIKVWSGSSAGAINAAYCAAQSENLFTTTKNLASLWENLVPQQIYNTDFLSLSGNSIKWIRDLSFGPLFKQKLAHHLLNTAPLLKLIEGNIPFQDIQSCIDKNYISGLACSTYCFNNSKTITFLQSSTLASWDRLRRKSIQCEIKAEHILASCSIPLLFPPTQINHQFYGDGGFRNTTPMSPTIHLGAQKILMIGVRSRPQPNDEVHFDKAPGIAKVAGSMLNALFFDTIDIDLERISHINEMIRSLKKDIKTERSDYSVVDYKYIRPSQDIAKIAEVKSQKGFPKMIQFLLDGLGSKKDTADLSSYILFDSSFTKELVELGYNDLMSQKEELIEWFEV